MWADSLYMRDQWQMSRALTLSLGVRWEYLPFGRRRSRIPDLRFSDQHHVSLRVGPTPTDCGVKVPKRDFSPRLGIAWRATPTFVMRAGFGINFDPNPLAWVRDFVGEAEITQSASCPPPPARSSPPVC